MVKSIAKIMALLFVICMQSTFSVVTDAQADNSQLTSEHPVTWNNTFSIAYSPYVAKTAVCGINSAHEISCWGRPAPNGIGQVKALVRSNCALTVSNTIACWDKNNSGHAVEMMPSDLGEVKQVDMSGYYHGCAITSLNELRCWGSADDSGYGNYAWPQNLGKVLSVSTNYLSDGCVVKFDHRVYCWGRGGWNGRSALVVPADLGPVIQVKVGLSEWFGSAYACAILINSQVRCFGNAQIVDNAPTNLTDVKQLNLGPYGVCVVTENGSLVCWKDAWGNGSEYYPPSSLGLVDQIVSDNRTSCALSMNSVATCWRTQRYGDSYPLAVEATNGTPQGIVLADSTLANKNPVTIIGDLSVDSDIVASWDGWGEEVQLTYQWMSDGQPIPGATSAGLKLTPQNFRHRISIQMTGSLAGYRSKTDSSFEQVVTAGHQVQHFSVKTNGSGKVNSLLSTDVEGLVEGNTATYQWFRDGTLLLGRSDSSIRLTPEDLGHEIFSGVTISKFGYESVTVNSPHVLVDRGTIDGPVTVRSSLVRTIGTTMRASVVGAPTGSTVDYLWFRDGDLVTSSIGNNYKISPKDAGRAITVKAIVSKYGYENLELSPLQGSLIAKPFDGVKVTGTSRVGLTLNASPEKFNSIFKPSYQWYLDSDLLSGETSNLIRILPEFAGKTLSVKVCATIGGEDIYCVSKSAPSPVALGRMNAVSLSVVGNANTQSSFSATVRNLPTNADVRYVWSVDGVQNADATSQTFTLNRDGKFHSVSLSVTVSKQGYEVQEVRRNLFVRG